ncbi:MAG: acyl-CoA dehydrogenase family protein [Actinobacteria bacterium]|nr:MAG: acyl-CoA dehydrogenase family protein [Actinomycetota bacterium]
MDFGLTDEQEALKKSAREFLTDRSTTALVRKLMTSKTGFDEGLWKEMSELGWLGTAIPEEDGGLGLGQIELAILAEETGRAILPAPFYSSAGLAAPVIAAAAEGTIRKELLGGIGRGGRRLGGDRRQDEGRQGRERLHDHRNEGLRPRRASRRRDRRRRADLAREGQARRDLVVRRPGVGPEGQGSRAGHDRPDTAARPGAPFERNRWRRPSPRARR